MPKEKEISGKILKDFDKDAKEIRKISSETFSKKISKLNERYKVIRIRVLSERKEKIKNAKSKQEISVIKIQYKQILDQIKNKYALLKNSFHRQELYRRGVLETKIDDARKTYHNKKHTDVYFNKVEEQLKLKKRIANLKKRYSRPVSTMYRRKRVGNINNKTNISNIKVPSSSLYVKYFKIMAMIVIASILTTFALDIFYKPFGLYNAGLRGITQIFYYIIQSYDHGAPIWYSHALFFGVNTPLFIWSWFKIGKKFTFRTFIFLITQYFTSLIFGVTGFYDKVMPFGMNAVEIVKSRQDGNLGDLYKYAVIFISTIVASIIYGIGVGFVYRAGGSTGGSKFIVTFISAKRNKSVGYFATIFGIFVILLGLSINGVVMDKKSFYDAYLSTTLLASLVFVFLSNYFLDITFNKSKKIKLQMMTDKKEEFLYFLDYYLMYDKTFSFSKSRKGHGGKDTYKFEIIANPLDVASLKNYFLSIDPNALIVETEIKNVSGRFFSSWFE